MNLIVEKLTFIVAAIKKFKYSFTCFGAIFIFSFISLSIKPLLHSHSILLIVLPLSHILSPVGVSVCPLPIGLVIKPFSLVYVSVRVVEYSFSIGFVELPLSDIFAAIGPGLRSDSLSHSVLPLSFVSDSVV